MSLQAFVEQALAHLANPTTRDRYFDLFADSVVLHDYEGVLPGLDGVKAFYQTIFTAFPDLTVHAHDFVEEPNKIAVRFFLTGTHQGPFQGIPPTGRPIQVPGITILPFENAQCVERLSELNSILLLTQLGAFPPPA